ncbi:hypothetical protein [Streptomyces phage phiScoe25]|nr:hypothetical protein [Streptomyces phage phiScoe25]
MSMADRIARWERHWADNPPPPPTGEQARIVRTLFGELQPARRIAA